MRRKPHEQFKMLFSCRGIWENSVGLYQLTLGSQRPCVSVSAHSFLDSSKLDFTPEPFSSLR